MEFGMIVNVAVIILTGLICGRLVTYIHLPNVTGYLLGGLLVGPSLLNIVSLEAIESMGIIPEIALAFIAFTIGLSFKISYFKRVGLTPVVIALLEATLAVVLVQGGLILAGFELPLAIVLGAIAAATAPAATVLVIKQYKAKGPVTDTLLSVVALDDAVAIVLFGFATTIAQSLMNTSAVQKSLLVSIVTPFWEIALALIVGAATGLLMKYAVDFFPGRGNRLAILLSFVFITTGLAGIFGVSELLACMMAGSIFTNLSLEGQLIGDLSDEITPPLYMMFFVLSGAELNLSIIPSIGLIGILYIVLRVVGKMLGAYAGGRIMKAPKEVSQYLGFMLIPQAGVAIGLAAVAEKLVPTHAAEIKAVVLVGTLIYELVGPIATKMALQKSGEIELAE